jgi:hypothetical protein
MRLESLLKTSALRLAWIEIRFVHFGFRARIIGILFAGYRADTSFTVKKAALEGGKGLATV